MVEVGEHLVPDGLTHGEVQASIADVEGREAGQLAPSEVVAEAVDPGIEPIVG